MGEVCYPLHVDGQGKVGRGRGEGSGRIFLDGKREKGRLNEERRGGLRLGRGEERREETRAER